MHSRFHLRCTLSLLWFLGILCLLQAQEIIPLKDIKPGMVGYGLSIFRGNQIERFQVEVLDIIDGFFPGENIILVRCSPIYGSFDIKRSGLIAGMSGSPIYFGDKLAGALSMGWAFAKEPLAGITPIETMLKIVERPMEKKLAHNIPSTLYPAIGGLVPMKTPIVVSGMAPNAFEKLEKELGKYGCFAIYGGGAGRARDKKTYQLVPGSAIGGQLMTGDLDMTAIGTVTWVNGDQVLAFGHSFFNAGEFTIPITTAHISAVMESNLISFKLGSPVEQVGTLLQDRMQGIYGKIGQICEMLPMTVVIKNRVHKTERTFHTEVIRHPALSSRLCAIGIFNFLEMQEATLGENTVWVRTKIHFQDEEPLLWSEIYASPLFIRAEFTGSLRYLYENPFKVVNVSKIEVEMEVAHKMYAATISSLHVNAWEVKPGEAVELKIGVTPYLKSEEFFSVQLPISSKMEPGSYSITAIGAQNLTPNVFVPENFKQYMQAIKKIGDYRNNQIVLMLELPQLKVLCKDQEMDNLPASVIGNLLPSNTNKNIQILSNVYEQIVDTPYVISGNVGIFINVEETRKKFEADKKEKN